MLLATTILLLWIQSKIIQEFTDAKAYIKDDAN